MTDVKVVQNETVPAYVIESVAIGGDLSKLTPEGRVNYYQAVCKSLGLNPLTQPFNYLSLNGKLVLYAKRDCTEQLRKIHGVSIEIKNRATEEGVYIVTAVASLPDGRVDESTGAVSIDKLSGDARANALMKAETKAKRRVTLSICGLGMLDETEVTTIPNAEFVEVDAKTGEIKAPAHWLDDEAKHKQFFACLTKRGLSDADAKKLLKLEHLHDWPGTAAEMLTAIDAATGKAA